MNSMTAGASAVVVPASATIARILEARLNKSADFDRQSAAVEVVREGRGSHRG